MAIIRLSSTVYIQALIILNLQILFIEVKKKFRRLFHTINYLSTYIKLSLASVYETEKCVCHAFLTLSYSAYSTFSNSKVVFVGWKSDICLHFEHANKICCLKCKQSQLIVYNARYYPFFAHFSSQPAIRTLRQVDPSQYNHFVCPSNQKYVLQKKRKKIKNK